MAALMTPQDLAELVGIPQRTLAQWRYLGTGPRYRKLGNHVRYDPADVESWLDENLVGGDVAS